MRMIKGPSGKDIPKELKGFNWGAYLLTFIWGIKHGVWLTFGAIPLIWFQLPYGINWILLFLLQLYCGLRGNEWAYQKYWWQKPSDFKRLQLIWAVSGVIVHTILPIIVTFAAIRFFKKSETNAIDYLRNTHCVVAHNNLKNNLTKTIVTPTSTQSEIAKSFSKNFANTNIVGNEVIFTSKRKQITDYSMYFIKSDEETCNLESRNCTVYSRYKLPKDVYKIESCIFYFDNQKNIKPDQTTKDALDKGRNILKYL